MEKVIVNKDACIGCGVCMANNPDYFKFNEDGLSSVIKEELDLNDKNRILEAIESCPTDSISIEEEKTA